MAKSSEIRKTLEENEVEENEKEKEEDEEDRVIE